MANLALPDGKAAAGGYPSGQFFIGAQRCRKTDLCMKKIYVRILQKKLDDVDCFAIFRRLCMKKLYSEALFWAENCLANCI
jgi:hypothetical protein